MSDDDLGKKNKKKKQGAHASVQGPSQGQKGVPIFDRFSLQMALADSVLHGSFADVKFSLFSRRLRNGRVGRPCSVYANSDILKAASPYFHGRMSHNYSALSS